MIEKSRISINQATTRTQWNFRECVEGYSRNGVSGIAIWRDKMHDCGLHEAKQLLEDHDMTVTGLNRAGPFAFSDETSRQHAIDDAKRAIDEAAEVRATCLLIFPGGLPQGSRDIAGARVQMVEVIDELLDVARKASVTLALEPLHPMLAADRSCLNTMAAANDLCDLLGEGLGIIVDVYHVWWDTQLASEILRAGKDRLVGFHVNDWLVPTRDPLLDRGMMGDGIIDIPAIRKMMDCAGYQGPVEVEIFSAANWWIKEPESVVQTCMQRLQTAV